MPAYLVGTVRVTEPAGYAAYGAAIKGLSARFGGESVLGGAVTEVFEGSSPVGERVVVVRFETADQARAYIASPEYVAGKQLRAGAAQIELRLIEI